MGLFGRKGFTSVFPVSSFFRTPWPVFQRLPRRRKISSLLHFLRIIFQVTLSCLLLISGPAPLTLSFVRVLPFGLARSFGFPLFLLGPFIGHCRRALQGVPAAPKFLRRKPVLGFCGKVGLCWSFQCESWPDELVFRPGLMQSWERIHQVFR